MKTRNLKYLFIGGMLASLPVFAEPVLFEDFSGPVSLNKFFGMEEGIQLDTTNQNVIMSAKGKAFSQTGRGNNLTLKDATTSLLQADVSLTELTTGNSVSQNAMLGISGTYYNAQSASPTDEVGDVFVRLTLGDRGNGPEAWYELQESTHPSFDDSTIVTGSFGVISLNTSYPMSIAYDGDNTFTLIFNNGTAVSIDGPARIGNPNAPFRAINQRLRFGRDNSSPDAWVKISDNGTPASIKGAVDNVTTDAGLVDDFSGSNLNENTWKQDQTSVALVNNKLEIRATGQGATRTERFFMKPTGADTFGAKVTLLSSSTINNTTRIRGRLTHFLSNDTYNVENGDTANGNEGMIWTQFFIERSAGNNRVVAYAERVKDAAWTTWDELFFTNLGPINLDQEYNMLIEKTGTLVEYKLDGVVVHSFNLATDFNSILSGNDFNPVANEGEGVFIESGLQARVQNDAGEVRVTFDDVVTDFVSQSLTLNAVNEDNTEVSFPADVIAHEGEVVDLVANVPNPADIAIFLWEQTAGPAVVAAKGFAGKVVGSKQNFSFTIPSGSNKQALAFKLTLVDRAGVESKQEFNVAVDNSITSTLAPTTSPAVTSGGGGGAFNPLMLIFGLSMLLGITRRKRS